MRYLLAPAVLTVAFILSSGAPAGEQGQDNLRSPRIVRLTITPSQVDAARRDYSFLPFDDGGRQNSGRKGDSLLPFDDGSRQAKGAEVARKDASGLRKTEELTQDDGARLYNTAAQGLPAQPDTKQLGDWLRLPLRDMPRASVQAAVQKAKANLEAVRQGAKCRTCKWMPAKAGVAPAHLAEYRQLALLLCLEARLEIAQGQYDQAVQTIGIGLRMAKHVGEAPAVVQGLTGVAIAAVMIEPLEDLTQVPGSPNLSAALRALPRPLVNLEVPIAAEPKNQESAQKVRIPMQRVDGNVAALQCIEALRHYAALHRGQLPKRLADVIGVPIPDDPVQGKPFAYQYDGSKAVLEIAVPQGGTQKDCTRYEITVAR